MINNNLSSLHINSSEPILVQVHIYYSCISKYTYDGTILYICKHAWMEKWVETNRLTQKGEKTTKI